MRIGVKLDFNETYEISNISPDFKSFEFTSIAKDDTKILLYVVITSGSNPFCPTVFNLGFGPLNEDGTINDRISVNHRDNAKVYSTLLLGALTFLKNSTSGVLLGIDGSDKIRSYLYYKLLQINHDYLIQHFRLIGVKYYVRLLRGQFNTDPYTTDNDDVASQPSIIEKNVKVDCDKLFNYFMFDLTHNS